MGTIVIFLITANIKWICQCLLYYIQVYTYIVKGNIEGYVFADVSTCKIDGGGARWSIVVDIWKYVHIYMHSCGM